MRALIQRVKKASVKVDNEVIGSIDKGILIFLGITHEDGSKEIEYLVDKIANLRIFEDEAGKLNLSLLDIKGEALIVSQFTLYADCRKGRRPGFSDAARPEQANELYEMFVNKFNETGLKTETGEFQAMMDVELTNDGPVTIMLET